METPTVPGVAGGDLSPIDAFVRARLPAKGLGPSPEADRRTLLRRLKYDLHGLPPTPEEVDDFVNDPDPQAYEHWVDRLLASPRYGERWGRHWLDVVHYGETHGYDKDTRRLNAWPYRDYVIRAFNEDKPYGRFVQEQLAGDVLFPDQPDGIVATGFIVAGPWDQVAQTELKEGTVDKQITRVLDRDDMVANTMSTFCSLTVHCARCHDHKFDPITQKDYYSLQAVFAGVERANRYYDPDKAVLAKRTSLLQDQKVNARELGNLTAERARVSSARIRALEAEWTALTQRIATASQLSNAVPGYGKGFHSEVAPSPFDAKWVQVDLGRSVVLDEVMLIPAHLKLGDFAGPGFGFPRRFKIEVSDEAEFKSSTLLADETHTDFPNPGDAPYLARKPGVRGRYVRVTATKLMRRDAKKDDWIFALSELVAVSGGKDVALGATVTSLDSVEAAPTWSRTNLVDGRSSWGVLFNPSPTDGFQSATAPKADTTKWVALDLGRPVPIEKVILVPARSRDSPDKAGFGFPVQFRLEAANDAEFKNVELIADKTGSDFENPGLQPRSFAATNLVARYVRLTATQLWKQKDDQYLLALSEIQVQSTDQTNVARSARISALDSLESGPWGVQFLLDGYSSLAALPEAVVPAPTEGYQSARSPVADAVKWVQLDLGKKVPVDTIRLLPALAPAKTAAGKPPRSAPGSTNSPRAKTAQLARAVKSSPSRPAVATQTPLETTRGFPVRFRIEIANDPAFGPGRRLVYESQTNVNLLGSQPFELELDALPARYVRVTATRLAGERGQYGFALAEVQVVSDGWNVARGAAVQALDSAELPGWSVQYLVDGLDRHGFLDNTTDVLAGLRHQAAWEQEARGRRREQEAQVTALLDDETNRRFDLAVQRAEDLEGSLGALPRQQLVFAAAHDFPTVGTFAPAVEPRPIHLLERGDVRRPGELVKPAPPAFLADLAAEFKLKDPANEGERRAALAHWISTPRNALTWRSIVNRVWSYHFGRGLVDTPNDFGNMGSAPTHPELLDWLAGEFLAHGQSLKWLHRQILLSATYRQSGASREDYARIDSGNQFLWRMNRDRLGAESFRDSLLQLSGRLDLTMGGPGFDLFEFKDDYSPHYYYEKYNPDDAPTWRRSVYRAIVRSVPDPLLETLDCADPGQSVPVRNTTITALQALSLLHNPFPLRMAERLAGRLELLSGSLPGQIDWAFRLVCLRYPTGTERTEFVAHAAKFGLVNTCRLLLNSNEFNFVD